MKNYTLNDFYYDNEWLVDKLASFLKLTLISYRGDEYKHKCLLKYHELIYDAVMKKDYVYSVKSDHIMTENELELVIKFYSKYFRDDKSVYINKFIDTYLDNVLFSYDERE